MQSFYQRLKNERVVLRPSPTPGRIPFPSYCSIEASIRLGSFNSAATGGPSQTSDTNTTTRQSITAHQANEAKPPAQPQQEHSIKVFFRMAPPIIIAKARANSWSERDNLHSPRSAQDDFDVTTLGQAAGRTPPSQHYQSVQQTKTHPGVFLDCIRSTIAGMYMRRFSSASSQQIPLHTSPHQHFEAFGWLLQIQPGH